MVLPWSFFFLLVLKEIQQFAKDALCSSKVAYVTIQLFPIFVPKALGIVIIAPTKRLGHSEPTQYSSASAMRRI